MYRVWHRCQVISRYGRLPGRLLPYAAWEHVRVRALRTPDERFADLPDFPWSPRYVDVGGLRMAYVEHGPADGEPCST